MTSAAAALVAGLFWLRASLVRTPRKLPNFLIGYDDGRVEGDVADLAEGVWKQSRLNAWAAGFAALAAVLTATSVLIGTRWD